MIRRQELCDRGCVTSLIHVIEQVPLRASVRQPLCIQRTSASLLLLWSALRWERTFVILLLEGVGVDLWAMTRDVDETLKSHRGLDRAAGGEATSDDLDSQLRDWLNRAAAEARSLHHDFLGGEHLLLAMLADGDPELAAIFQRRGLTHDALKAAVVDAFSGAARAEGIASEVDILGPGTPIENQPGTVADVERSAGDLRSSWIADIDQPAVGVPRRFGVFVMMLMVTLYAVLFSAMRLLRADNVVFVLLALLFTGIGVCQAVLFGGRYPRAASIWAGSILVPIGACVYVGWISSSSRSHMPGSEIVMGLLVVFVLSIPLGAIFGYLFGTLTAGSFYFLDWYEKRSSVKEH